jgi:2'-5' RNA ligase
MKRLFVGVPISTEIKAEVVPLLKELNNLGIKTTPINNLHFTLKFLGEVKDSETNEIIEILQNISISVPQFEINLTDLDAFPNQNDPQVLWIGTESKELIALMRKMNRELEYIRKDEHQKEIPHLTLARIKLLNNQSLLNNIFKKWNNVKFGKMKVEHFCLYESTLKKEGPEYKIIKNFLLSR